MVGGLEIAHALGKNKVWKFRPAVLCLQRGGPCSARVNPASIGFHSVTVHQSYH